MTVSSLFQNGRRPNILIIISDQERALQHWPESFSRDHLPAMERLKKHGLNFNHHYTNSCMCSPSRSTMLTSQFPVKTGVTRTGSPGPPRHMPTTLPNLATILKEAGYPRVEWHGKWHVGKTPADYGFEGWQPPDAGNYLAVNDTLGGGTPDNDGRFLENLCDSLDHYKQSQTNNNSQQQQHQRQQQPSGDEGEEPASATTETEMETTKTKTTHPDEPFCVVASFVNPHDVYVAQHGPAKGYTTEDLHKIKVPLPSNYMEDCDENGKPRSHGQMSSRCVPFECTHQEYVNFYAYLHTVVDARIGTLLDKVDDLGLTENTLIFRTADHGEQGLSHSLVEKFFNCYQESLRIPLVVSNPIAFPEPQSTDALSSHLDLLPTLAGLLGVEDTQSLQGTDLTRVLDDPQMTTTIELDLERERDSETVSETNSEQTTTTPSTIKTKATTTTTFPGIQKSIHFTYDDISFPGAPSTIRCLHKGTLKYAVYFLPSGKDADWELYDLRNDPLENNNLAGIPEHKALQEQLDRELYETMVEKETLPKAFRWPPKPTIYSVGFDHPPQREKLLAQAKLRRAERLEELRLRKEQQQQQQRARQEDPIQFYEFADRGETVSVTLGIRGIGAKCSLEDDIDLVCGKNAVVLHIDNYLAEEISLAFGKPKAEVQGARCEFRGKNELVVILTKKDPELEWTSFHD